MKLPLSYEANSKRASLSARLHSLLPEKDTFFTYIDPKIKKQDLSYNISYTLANIISNLSFADKTKDTFFKLLVQYNLNHESKLSYEDLLSISWIRMINEEIVISETVGYFIWNWNYNEEQGKELPNIPPEKLHHIGFLRTYLHSLYPHHLPTISTQTLSLVLENYAHKEIDVEFLTTNNILKKKEEGDYSFHGHEYTRHLRNEIAGKLWIIISKGVNNLENLRHFLRLCQHTQLYPHNLPKQTTIQDMSHIRDLSIQLLNTESDLINNGTEFEKIWFDQHRHNNVKIFQEAPYVKLESRDPHLLLEEFESHELYYREALVHQHCRSPYTLLIRFALFPGFQGENNPYAHILDLLNSTNRPFIITETYRQICENYPEVIPYLLDDSELTPIAFKAIDKCKIDEKLLRRNRTREEQYEDEREQLNVIWLELFEITLDQIAQNQDSRLTGKLVYRLLENVCRKMFNTNSSNAHSVIQHYVYKKRLQTVFQLLGTKRINGATNFSLGAFNARLFPLIANDIFSNIKESKPTSYQLDHLNFESSLLNLMVELLKLVDIKYVESETHTTKPPEILRNDIVTFLAQIIEEYFTTHEIKVWDFFDNKFRMSLARRGIGNFGIELIDWSYLYLLFNKLEKTEQLYRVFQNSIKFDLETPRKIYADINQEQIEKIRFQLTTLMLGFIGISERKELYAAMGFQTDSTLTSMEKMILDIALSYCEEDKEKVKINIFSDVLFFTAPTLYSKSLSKLMYKCLNHLSPESIEKLANGLFKNSKDIGKMMAAINVLENVAAKKRIKELIDKVDINQYIDDAGINLENTLVEVVNSKYHWKDLAEPLVNRMRDNLEKRNEADTDSKRLLFEVYLVLAFKRNDYKALIETEVPEYHSQSDYNQDFNTKLFFEAIHLIYNEKKYDIGLEKLETLKSNDDKNVKYAYHIFRGKTLKAIDRNG